MRKQKSKTDTIGVTTSENGDLVPIKEVQKTVAEQIDDIIRRNYNNYIGKKVEGLQPIHREIRNRVGDWMFLAYLEKQERDNPKPIFNPKTSK